MSILFTVTFHLRFGRLSLLPLLPAWLLLDLETLFFPFPVLFLLLSRLLFTSPEHSVTSDSIPALDSFRVFGLAWLDLFCSLIFVLSFIRSCTSCWRASSSSSCGIQYITKNVAIIMLIKLNELQSLFKWKFWKRWIERVKSECRGMDKETELSTFLYFRHFIFYFEVNRTNSLDLRFNVFYEVSTESIYSRNIVF